MMKGVYLLLGSNLGDSQATLQSARRHIKSRIGEIVKSSSVYLTKAWGIENQPDFLNQVLEVETSRDPLFLLHTILDIEKKLGRVRYKKWHSRIIDIDILYYGSEIIDLPQLIIPHPENQNRNFVLAPMAEIAPDFIHPKLGITQRQLLERSTDTLKVETIVPRK